MHDLVTWVVLVSGAWTLFLALVGLVKGRRREEVTGGAAYRVLVIVPAHNEAAVVEDTVMSILYAGCGCVVLADSCTDQTYAIAARCGVHVVRGDWHSKAGAINGFLAESLLPFAYDALAVVDCGTVVGREFGTRLVAGLGRAEYVQGWVRSAGPLTAVGAWYSWQYGLFHLTQLGRSVLGLPAWIGGTGFGWRATETVRFEERCLVEDLELSLRLHASGKRVAYVDLGVFDEKPSTLRASFRQRVRWARGGWWLFLRGAWLSPRIDDVVAVLTSFASVICALWLVQGLVVNPLGVVALVIWYGVIGAAGMVLLGDDLRFRLTAIPMIAGMSLIEGVVSVSALCSVGSRTWSHTVHHRMIGQADRTDAGVS